MKKLFLTLVVVGLVACNSTEETTCCPADTADQVDAHPTDDDGLPFEIDSITNVSQLLDSLGAVPPKNF
jgi:hypothetical protein